MTAPTISTPAGDAEATELAATTEALLAAEAAGQPVTWELWIPFADACKRLGADEYTHFKLVRNDSPAPDGRHGLFPGNRCVYCYSNDLDVSLYAVDPAQCPPVWACGEGHPEDRIAHCQLGPEHEGLHSYEWLDWPEYPNLDQVDETISDEDLDRLLDAPPVQGPPMLHTLTWAA